MTVLECMEQAVVVGDVSWGWGGEGVVSVDPAVMLSDEEHERCESTQTDKLSFLDLNSKYRILSRLQNVAIHYHVLPKLKRKCHRK